MHTRRPRRPHLRSISPVSILSCPSPTADQRGRAFSWPLSSAEGGGSTPGAEGCHAEGEATGTRSVGSTHEALRAIHNTASGLVSLSIDMGYLMSRMGDGGSSGTPPVPPCIKRDTFVADCRLPTPGEILESVKDLDDLVPGSRAELWACSTPWDSHSPYAMVCVRDDMRALYFVRVEVGGGAPRDWSDRDGGFFGATVRVESFSWDTQVPGPTFTPHAFIPRARCP